MNIATNYEAIPGQKCPECDEEGGVEYLPFDHAIVCHKCKTYFREAQFVKACEEKKIPLPIKNHWLW